MRLCYNVVNSLGGITMIVYNRLANYLKANNMKWIDLQNGIGVSPSVMAKLQKNRNVNTETLDKVCTFLKVQPYEIMEWVEDEDTLREKEILAQIETLKKELEKIKK